MDKHFLRVIKIELKIFPNRGFFFSTYRSFWDHKFDTLVILAHPIAHAEFASNSNA